MAISSMAETAPPSVIIAAVANQQGHVKTSLDKDQGNIDSTNNT